MNRPDVRMIQRCQHLRFPFEPRQAIGIAGECRRQDLDGDVAIQLGIARPVDLAHAADAEQAVDAKHADLHADRASIDQAEGRGALSRRAIDQRGIRAGLQKGLDLGA